MSGFRTCILALTLSLGLIPFARAQNNQTRVQIKKASSLGPFKKLTLDWESEMGMQGFSENRDEGLAASLYLRTRATMRLMPWLSIHATPRLRLFSSRLQERFDGDTYSTQIRPGEAFINFHAQKYAELHVGAIGQSFLRSPMLISQFRAFPGIYGKLSTADLGPVTAELHAQLSVPTSNSLNTQRTEREATPTFETQSVNIGGKHFARLEWKAFGGRYAWANMPNKVASVSGFLGNSNTDVNMPQNSQFRYGNRGWFWGSEVCYCGPEAINFIARYQGNRNAFAPSDSADAQLWGLGPKIKFGDTELELLYSNYFLESDSSIAAYVWDDLGNTNRQGQRYEARLNFKDKGFAIFAEYTRAALINAEPTGRGVLTMYYMGVETQYAPF